MITFWCSNEIRLWLKCGRKCKKLMRPLSETPMMFMKTLMTALITSLFMNDDDVGMATEETTVLRVTDTPDTFCGTAVWWGRLGLCYQGHQHQDQPLQRKHSPSKQWICWEISFLSERLTFPSASSGRSEQGLAISSARQVLHMPCQACHIFKDVIKLCGVKNVFQKLISFRSLHFVRRKIDQIVKL